jgi:hypothetical protein
LVFVIGSGINKSYGIPDWRELLEKLLADSGRVSDASLLRSNIGEQLQAMVPDPLLQGAVGRQGYMQPTLWLDSIRKHVREQPSMPASDPQKPLYRIANLVMSQYEKDRHRHISVLTFNYDDLLEKALEARALPEDQGAIIRVFREQDYAPSLYRSGVFVYHLHGYAYSDMSPILDAGSYLRVLGSPGRHWSWDCMTATLLQRDTAAMFLGLSLVDPSLRLLLTHWAEKGLPVSGVYVSAPLPAPPVSLDYHEQLKVAKISRDILRLFDEVLEELSLVPYHVTVWDEILELLEVVENDGTFLH